VAIAAVIALWEVAADAHWINALYFSSPRMVVATLLSMLGDGTLMKHTGVSATELGIGFLLSSAVGIPIGMLCGWYRSVNALLNPFISAGYITPRIALVPIIILWFGIGLPSKVALVFLMAFFPMVITMAAAMRDLDANLIRVARAVGASDWQIFRTIAVPGSVPYIITALQLGLGLGLTGVVVGELYAATAGLGFLVAQAGGTFQTDVMFAAVVVLVGGGGLGLAILSLVERRFSTWRPPRS
jgi:NitT/TauT family transport system permease protein